LRQKSTRAVAVERLDMNSPAPPGTNDLSQSLRVVLIRLVDLHLEGGACLPGIETNDFEPEIAKFMHEPWRRTKMLICSGIVGHWPRHSLQPSFSTAQIAVIFCETSNPTKWVIDVRITGQRRPDRGTIGRSGANRDYRMSIDMSGLRRKAVTGVVDFGHCGGQASEVEPDKSRA
jgi:hypothetical protein